jgi:hypothetical protein
MLIQVMATLLGFTLVVVFYYLGKFDNQKKNSVSSIIQVKKEMRQHAKTIDAAFKGLKVTYGAPVKPKSAALEDQVTGVFDSFTQITLDEFEKISNYVIPFYSHRILIRSDNTAGSVECALKLTQLFHS